MRANAAVRVELGARDDVHVRELRSDVPLVLRLTGRRPGGAAPSAAPPPGTPATPPSVTVHLVGAAAGPLAGDDLRLDISVGAGVRLVLRSVAAMVALPGRGAGDRPSRLTVTAQVGPGGELDFQPEPTVVAAGADHAALTEITLDPTARLWLREEILLGRFGESAGSFHSMLRVDISPGAGVEPRTGASTETEPAVGTVLRGGTIGLLRHELALGPDTPGLHGPAQLGAARAVGSLVVAGPEWAGPGPESVIVGRGSQPGQDDHAGRGGGEAALMPLAGPGYLVTALAPDAVSLRRLLATAPGSHPSGRRPAR
ncbi:urease accessory protein UreD [Frankia sp. R82]|uniref:urease accessory protein UreD n=1 Tax=Frankia sp. R82 TaxID=2950553 RepID=UPI002043A97B|nr:urease accessory protein UreD [Frankia sp. R82]MCM3884747.1 urease accessory protein UreD [Frankia sp. R82]